MPWIFWQAHEGSVLHKDQSKVGLANTDYVRRWGQNYFCNEVRVIWVLGDAFQFDECSVATSTSPVHFFPRTVKCFIDIKKIKY